MIFHNVRLLRVVKELSRFGELLGLT